MDFKSYIQSDAIFQGSSVNRYLRFIETAGQFNGAYLQFEGSTNKFHIGVHDAADALEASDTKVVTIQRSNGFIGINNESPTFEIDMQGTFRNEGVRISPTFTDFTNRVALVNPSFGGTRLGDSELQTPNLDIGTALNFKTTAQQTQWATFSNASGNTLTWRHIQNPTALFSIINSGTGITNGVDDVESTLGLVTEYDTGDPHVYDLFNQHYAGAGSIISEAQGVNMIAPVGDHRKYGIYRSETGLTNLTAMFDIDGASLATQVATFYIPTVVPDEAYSATWDGDFSVPTKNAVYDQIESLGGGNFVTLDTAQTITGQKTFSSTQTFNGALVSNTVAILNAGSTQLGNTLIFPTTIPAGVLSTAVRFGVDPSNRWYFTKINSANSSLHNIDALTDNREVIWQDADGTVAYLSDVPNTADFVTTNTVQTITSGKTFNGGLTVNSTGIGSIPAVGGTLPLLQFDYATPGQALNSGASSYLFANNFGHMAWTGNGSTAAFDNTAITTSRTYILPDSDGTLALTSDLPATGDFVTTNTVQSIGSNKTFNNNSSLTVHRFIIVGDTGTTDGNVGKLLMTKRVASAAGVGDGTFTQLYADVNGNFTIRASGKNDTIFNAANITAQRTYDLPDADGELVLESEGTFTPSLVDGGSGATFTFNTFRAEYKVVGELIYVNVILTEVSSTAALTGDLVITGMPFSGGLSTQLGSAFVRETSASNIVSNQGILVGTNLFFSDPIDGSNLGAGLNFSSSGIGGGTVRANFVYATF